MFRLYTEDTGVIGRSLVWNVLERAGVKGATMLQGTGMWEGDLELSLIIELAMDLDDAGAVRSIAQLIKTELKQRAVLIVYTASVRYIV